MIRLTVRCSPAEAEAVLAELVVLAPNGVEEEEGAGWVEYSIYGGEGELPDLGPLEAGAGEGVVEIRSETVPDDWADRWRDFHKATSVAGGRVVIRPSWVEVDGPAAPVDVVLDPGQAFGTGAHATTRMCVELLVELADSGPDRGALVDLGTGSAVLAIVAAKLGFAPVSGVDLELAALDAARANVATNGVEVALARANLRVDDPPPAPTVAANLTAPLLREVAARLPSACERLVCSGLLAREADEVAEAFGRAGLRQVERRDSGDWSALLLERA